MISNILYKIFTTDRYKKIPIKDLPSQGYFYPENLVIKIEKANIQLEKNETQLKRLCERKKRREKKKKK